MDQALDRAAAGPPGLIVIADKADNTGGGAPGDFGFMTRPVIQRRLTDVAIGPLWDPVAVGFAATPASARRSTLRIGGKCGPESGDPLDVTVEVRGVSDKLVQRGLGRPSVLGRAAWVEADGAHLILVERREQVFLADLFTNMGLDLTAMRIAVVNPPRTSAPASRPSPPRSSPRSARARCSKTLRPSPTRSATSTIGRGSRTRSRRADRLPPPRRGGTA